MVTFKFFQASLPPLYTLANNAARDVRMSTAVCNDVLVQPALSCWLERRQKRQALQITQSSLMSCISFYANFENKKGIEVMDSVEFATRPGDVAACQGLSLFFLVVTCCGCTAMQQPMLLK
jgi:hypothetical protein